MITPTPNTLLAHVQSVACPRCGAVVGAPCPMWHRERKRAANARTRRLAKHLTFAGRR